MITLSIDVTKVDKNRFYKTEKGASYLNLILIENKNGPDQYGNDGFVKQGLTKEESAKPINERPNLPILGNYKVWGKKTNSSNSKQSQSIDDHRNNRPDQDDIPF